MTPMQLAIKQAEIALNLGEVPIGAVIVDINGKIIAKAYNSREKTKNAVNHAEILAIQKACKKFKDWRLLNCTMYVTQQPCPMCMGAITNARIKCVVFGSKNLNLGLSHVCEQLYQPSEIAQNLVKNFFKTKRV
ncbi:MAG: nucleoside deaminase [Clostridia bacterium]